ncbi:MAG: hypothetical protein WA364_26000 [Candidatus Nitrosopolaris sp.]
MSSLVLVLPMYKSEIDKLPKRERTIIQRYITPLHVAISDLLNSDDTEFQYNFERTKTRLLLFSSLVAMTLEESQFVALMKKFSSRYRRSKPNTPVERVLYNANEIIVDFLRLAFEISGKNKEFLPDYAEAFVPAISLIVHSTVLAYAIEKKSQSRNIPRIVEECKTTARILEGWVDTIEIETDSEQRAILERVKQTPL